MNTTTTNEPASRRALRSTHRVLIKGMFTAINFSTHHVSFFLIPNNVSNHIFACSIQPVHLWWPTMTADHP